MENRRCPHVSCVNVYPGASRFSILCRFPDSLRILVEFVFSRVLVMWYFEAVVFELIANSISGGFNRRFPNVRLCVRFTGAWRISILCDFPIFSAFLSSLF